MSRHAGTRLGASAALVLSVCVAVAAPAAATPPSGAALAAALDAPAGVTVSAGSSDPVAYRTATTGFNDFPSKGSDYVLLSTGKVADVFSPSVPNRQPSTDLGAAGPDTTSLVITVPGLPAARCLLVDFAMATEERVHTYVPSAPSDQLSVMREGSSTEHAVNTGGAYFAQEGMDLTKVPAPVPYEVNKVDYWHQPGDDADPLHGTVEDPRLPDISAVDNFTTRDTAEVPLPAGGAQVVNISIKDVGNGLLDSIAIVDNLRLDTSCSAPAEGMSPSTGVAAVKATIVGHRGVGNLLTLDPVRSTGAVERYDNKVRNEILDGNGWFTSNPDDHVELRFRWYRGSTGGTLCYSTELKSWTAIPDADRQSYVPTNLDKGKCLMALVTGVKDGYRHETFPTTGASHDAWYVTLPIQDGTFDGQQPTIACDLPPVVGSELSASVVDFVPRPDSYTYQWYANGAVISGQTGQKVVLSAAEAGKLITVKVTGKRSGFDDRAETSAACGPVGLLTMTTTSAPIITGPTTYGATLGVDTGTWDPVPSSFSYQWRVNDAPITGATRSTYAPKTSDVGQQITVLITGAKTGYAPVARVSEAVGIDVAAMPGTTPVVSGTSKVGETLTASAGGWLPAGSSLTYSWFAGTTLLKSGTSRIFRIPGSAVGKKVTVVVRGTRIGYESTDRASTPTAAVAKAALVTTTPRITGTKRVGRTLRAYATGWGPYGVRLTYRWRLNGRSVGGATKSSWRLPKSAKGKRVTVTVTGTMTGYTTRARTSARTSRIGR